MNFKFLILGDLSHSKNVFSVNFKLFVDAQRFIYERYLPREIQSQLRSENVLIYHLSEDIPSNDPRFQPYVIAHSYMEHHDEFVSRLYNSPTLCDPNASLSDFKSELGQDRINFVVYFKGYYELFLPSSLSSLQSLTPGNSTRILQEPSPSPSPSPEEAPLSVSGQIPISNRTAGKPILNLTCNWSHSNRPCGVVFRDQNGIRILKHVVEEHLKSQKICQWIENGQLCNHKPAKSGQAALQTHVITHIHAPFYVCELCGKDYKRVQDFEKHLRTCSKNFRGFDRNSLDGPVTLPDFGSVEGETFINHQGLTFHNENRPPTDARTSIMSSAPTSEVRLPAHDVIWLLIYARHKKAVELDEVFDVAKFETIYKTASGHRKYVDKKKPKNPFWWFTRLWKRKTKTSDESKVNNNGTKTSTPENIKTEQKEHIEIERLKTVIVGDSRSGKTNLARRLDSRAYDPNDLQRICDKFVVERSQDDKTVEIEVTDTANGGDADKSRVRNYRDADVVILAFSIADPKSMENVVEK
ncbi:GTP-binding protein Rho1, partial [Nowakowskiella sp. JEL0407]